MDHSRYTPRRRQFGVGVVFVSKPKKEKHKKEFPGAGKFASCPCIPFPFRFVWVPGFLTQRAVLSLLRVPRAVHTFPRRMFFGDVPRGSDVCFTCFSGPDSRMSRNLLIGQETVANDRYQHLYVSLFAIFFLPSWVCEMVFFSCGWVFRRDSVRVRFPVVVVVVVKCVGDDGGWGA